MSRRVIILPEADEEIHRAAEWYGRHVASLANDFRLTVETEISGIVENPFLHPVVYRRARMATLPRFPYSLYYRVSDEEIVIASCFHQRRHPKHWRKRF